MLIVHDNWFGCDILCMCLIYFGNLHAHPLSPPTHTGSLPFLVSFPPTCMYVFCSFGDQWAQEGDLRQPGCRITYRSVSASPISKALKKRLTLSHQPLTAHRSLGGRTEPGSRPSLHPGGLRDPTVWACTSNPTCREFRRTAPAVC